MEPQETMEKAILITNISQPLDWKIEIQSNNDKYSFGKTKQDGQPTKAYTQFQAMRSIIGDTVRAMVTETPKTFTDKTGKLVNYTDRRIAYFIEDKAAQSTQLTQSPTQVNQPTQPTQPTQNTQPNPVAPVTTVNPVNTTEALPIVQLGEGFEQELSRESRLSHIEGKIESLEERLTQLENNQIKNQNEELPPF